MGDDGGRAGPGLAEPGLAAHCSRFISVGLPFGSIVTRGAKSAAAESPDNDVILRVREGGRIDPPLPFSSPSLSGASQRLTRGRGGNKRRRESRAGGAAGEKRKRQHRVTACLPM